MITSFKLTGERDTMENLANSRIPFKSKYTIALILSLLVMFFSASTVMAESPDAKTYYVSMSEGNDDNDGLSQEQPFQTLTKMSEMTFHPGDEILLKSGDTWTEQTLTPEGQGTAANPIVISSYGEGEKPHISPSEKDVNAVEILEQGGWEIHNLQISNCLFGIYLRYMDVEVKDYIVIKNCDFFDIDNEYNSRPGLYNHISSGINVALTYPNDPDLLEYIALTNLDVSDCNFDNVNCAVWNGAPFDVCDPGNGFTTRRDTHSFVQGVKYTDCFAKNGAQWGYSFVFMKDSLITNCDADNTGFGDNIYGAAGCVVAYSMDMVLDGCDMKNSHRGSNPFDGCGFDFEGGRNQRNITFKNATIENSDGCGIFFCVNAGYGTENFKVENVILKNNGVDPGIQPGDYLFFLNGAGQSGTAASNGIIENVTLVREDAGREFYTGYPGQVNGVTMTNMEYVTLWEEDESGVILGENLAKGASVTASSTENNPVYSAEGIVNGDIETSNFENSWCSQANELPGWVEIALDGEKTFNYLELYSVAGYVQTAYNVSYWDDGSWQQLFSPVTGNRNVKSTHTFVPVTTTKLKIELTVGCLTQPEFARIKQVRLFNAVDDSLWKSQPGLNGKPLVIKTMEDGSTQFRGNTGGTAVYNTTDYNILNTDVTVRLDKIPAYEQEAVDGKIQAKFMIGVGFIDRQDYLDYGKKDNSNNLSLYFMPQTREKTNFQINANVGGNWHEIAGGTLNMGLLDGDSFTVSLRKDGDSGEVRMYLNEEEIAANYGDFNADLFADGKGYVSIANNVANVPATAQFTVMPIKDGTALVEKVTLSDDNLSLELEGTHTLIATILPENAAIKDIIWQSNNMDAVTVDSNGEITAVGYGKATITATSVHGKKRAKCNVNVVEKSYSITALETPGTSITITNDKIRATEGEDITFKVTVTDAGKEIDTVKIIPAGQEEFEPSGTEGDYSFTMPAADVSIRIELKDKNKEIRAELQKALDEAEKITDLSIYSKDSLEAFTVAKQQAEDVLADLNAADTAITQAISQLQAAISGLVEKGISEHVAVTKVTLDKTVLTLKEGDKASLIATVIPANATNKALIWSSSNSGVATVKDGVVTAAAGGKAIITVVSQDSKKAASCEVTVTKKEIVPANVKVSSVKANMKAKVLKPKKSIKLTGILKPANASDKKLSFNSSKKSVATVSKTGKVVAKKEGRATITITAANGKKVKVDIIVKKKAVPVKSVKLNKTSLTLKKGKKEMLKATLRPSKSTSKKIYWESSNKKVATVNSKGIVKGVGKGQTKITVYSYDGAKKKTCTVRVR